MERRRSPDHPANRVPDRRAKQWSQGLQLRPPLSLPVLCAVVGAGAGEGRFGPARGRQGAATMSLDSMVPKFAGIRLAEMARSPR